MKTTKTIIAPDRKEYSCICIRVFGTYIWIPINQKRDFFHCCRLPDRLCQYSEKAERQLRKIQELASQIEMLSLPDINQAAGDSETDQAASSTQE